MLSINYRNGDKMPIIGLGTWKSEPGELYSAVRESIRLGYRHFDCAAQYDNEVEVGKALHDSMKNDEIKREDIWVTSKLPNNGHLREDVLPSLSKTLTDLKLDYLNLYLIHWPVAYKPEINWPEKSGDYLSLEEAPLLETWAGMIECRKLGLVKHIGVSNFSINKLQKLIISSDFIPEVNQIERHPYLSQLKLVEFCKSNNINIIAYSPLGSGDRPKELKSKNESVLLENPIVKTIAKKYRCSPAQILISWSLKNSIAVIPKSTNSKRLKDNFDSVDINISDNDMERLSTLNIDFRYVHGKYFIGNGSPYTLENIWD